MEQNTKIRKTKEALLDAFCALAEDGRAEDITVTALCKKAGINRTTFYKYYAVPSDVLVEKAKEIAAGSFDISEETGRSLYDRMLFFCHVFYENRKFISLYFHACGDLMPIIYRGIAMSAENTTFLNKPENNFLAGGVGGLALYWLRRDFQDSPEVVAELLTNYIERFQK